MLSYAGTDAHVYYPAVEKEAKQIVDRALADPFAQMNAGGHSTPAAGSG